MISMDSLNSSAFCPRCGCKAIHSNSGEYTGALGRHSAELEFKRAHPQRQVRHRRGANTLGRYADVEIPVYYRTNAANNAGTFGQLISPYMIKAVASYNF